MTVMVTGGTGFLGSYFTRHAILAAHEERVVVLEKYADRGRIDDVLDHVTLIEGDVADFDTVHAAIRNHGVGRIAHFASILGSPVAGQMIPYVRIQSLGTANVFEAARLAGAKRVLFCSSVAAYGKQDAPILTEDLAVNPTDPYGSSKVWAEALGRHYTQQLGLEVISLRFGSTYGLGRASRGSYRSGILQPPAQIHYMARIEQAHRGQSIVMPDGDALADWTYAGDAAQAAWLALNAEALPRHLYNVCADRRPIGDFTEALRELLPEAVITTSGAEPPGNAHAPMDGTLLKEQLGFVPAFTLHAGVKDYLSRLRAHDLYWRG